MEEIGRLTSRLEVDGWLQAMRMSKEETGIDRSFCRKGSGQDVKLHETKLIVHEGTSDWTKQCKA